MWLKIVAVLKGSYDYLLMLSAVYLHTIMTTFPFLRPVSTYL